MTNKFENLNKTIDDTVNTLAVLLVKIHWSFSTLQFAFDGFMINRNGFILAAEMVDY